MKPSDLSDDEAITAAILLGGELQPLNVPPADPELWICCDPRGGPLWLPRNWCHKTKGEAARAFLERALELET